MSTDVHALAGAYALDALAEIERVRFDRHLAGCPVCGEEVAELRATAARLADLTIEQPPPGLRDRVLAQAAVTSQAGPWRRPAPGRWRRWRAAAVAGVVVLAGAGGFAVQEWRVQDARQASEDAQAASRRDAAESDRIAAVLTAPDVTLRIAPVRGTGGQVTVAISASRDQGVAMLRGFVEPGSDHAYQLWLMHDGAPVSAGVLGAGAGDGTRLLTDVRAASTLAVTREPAGGSPQPTSRVLIGVALAQ